MIVKYAFDVEISEDAKRALAHIRGRTRSGRFACRLWDYTDDEWDAALSEIRAAGYSIRWTYGTVADDLAVRGGWVLVGCRSCAR